MLPAHFVLKRKRASTREDEQATRDNNGPPSVSLNHSKSGQSRKPQWTKADVPDFLLGQMDGFLGLEELDGVDAGDMNQIRPEEEYEETSPTSQQAPDFYEFDESTVVSKKKKKKLQNPKQKHSAPGEQAGTPNDIRTAEEDLHTRARYHDLPPDTAISLPAWEGLTLSDGILRGLHRLGFEQPSNIQSLAIPAIMAGHDVVGKASTGSGKTLAFGIPVLEHISTMRTTQRSTAALILAPTRELAQQITQHLQAVGALVGVSILTITGGLASEKQIRLLNKVPDIIVATPGRLWDLISSHEGLSSQISKIQFLVLDEADRLLQKGHFEEVTKVIDILDSATTRQTLVFSATFQAELQKKLIRGNFKQESSSATENDDSLLQLLHQLRFNKTFKFFDANPESQVVQSVRQAIIELAPMEKDYFLYYLLLRYPARTMVFTNSISDVHRLVRLLSLLGIVTLGLHSNKQQKSRLKAIEKFKSDDKAVLIASDVAARGLDIPLVDTVIHYHLPRTADLYVHRSGRTARGSARGLSLLLCSSNEKPLLRKMQSTLRIDTLEDFPISTDYVGQAKPRVNLARQILKLEDDVHHAGEGRDAWLAEAAADLGVETLDEDSNYKLKQTKVQMKKLRAELSDALQRKFAHGFSGKYLTKGSAALAERLLLGDTNKYFIGEKVQKLSEHRDS